MGRSSVDVAPGTNDKRGALQAGYCPTTESQKDCNEVMRKDLQQWLVEHGISGQAWTAFEVAGQLDSR